MSLEECSKRKIELNDELNHFKIKWNIVEANRNFWMKISSIFANGSKKTQITSSYHFRKALINCMLTLTFSILPYTLPIAIGLFIITIFHCVRAIIFANYNKKFKKGIEITQRNQDKCTTKQQEIEYNQSLIYAQLNQLESMPTIPPHAIENNLIKEATARFYETTNLEI